MSTTEQRFEVPPEYADVYERAYRRAYDESQGVATTEVAPRRLTGRGKRVAIPEQRTVIRRDRTDVRPGGSHVAHEDRASRAPAGERRTSHRADPHRGSTLLPALALLLVLALLLAGAFVLGRVTAP